MSKTVFTSFFDTDRKPLLALVLVPFLVYLRSLWFEFSPLDEEWMVLKNGAFLKEWGSIITVFTEPFNVSYYRPLVFVSFIVDYHFGELSPFFYHLTNLALHLANVVLMYYLLMQYQVSRKVSFFILLLFSFHPALLGCVVWVPGRNDTLLALFFVAGLLAQNLYFKTSKFKYLLIHLLMFLGTLLTKESAILFPFIYCINACLLGYKFRVVVFKSTLPMGIIALVWFLIRKNIVGEIPTQGSDLLAHVMNAIKAMLVYFGKSFIPFQQSVFPTLLNSSIIPGAITVLAILILVLKAHFKNKRIALFGLFIFMALLVLPVWFMSDSVSREQYENRMYTSMFGMLLFVSQIEFKLPKNLGRIVITALALLYLSLTVVRMNYYSSQIRFLSQASEDNPDNYFFQFRLADHYFLEKDYQRSVTHYSNALRIQPSKGVFYNNRANAYKALGDKVNAIKDYDSAVVRSNFDPGVRLNKCMAYFEFNEIHLAMIELYRLKACCQDRIPPMIEKKIAEAWEINIYQKISDRILNEPTNAILYANRAKLFYDLGMFNEALKDLDKAMEIDPTNTGFKQYVQAVKSASATK
jgi:hypothetical protein